MQAEASAPGPLRVLAVDGGGIRGMIPAMVLDHLEQLTGKPCCELFDLVAGTSTGAICALGIAVPVAPGARLPRYSGADLVSLYRDEGPLVFGRRWFRRLPGFKFMGDLAGPKYPARGVEEVLRRRFAHDDGSEIMLSEALVDAIVPTYDIAVRAPYFFKRSKARVDLVDDAPVWQVTRAAAAAPSFFPPALVEPGRGRRVLVDGGVVANNPAMCAYIEALEAQHRRPDLILVSLGTGEHPRPIGYREASGWGVAGWSEQLMGVLLDGESDAVDHQLRRLMAPGRYYRFQTRLLSASDAMDDTSTANLQALERTAHQLLAEHVVPLGHVARLLAAAAA